MIPYSRKAVLLAGMVLILFTAFAVHAQDIHKISKEELRAELGNPGVVVIDVRADNDWRPSQFKIRSAAREEPNRVPEWIGKYPKDIKIILYCA